MRISETKVVQLVEDVGVVVLDESDGTEILFTYDEARGLHQAVGYFLPAMGYLPGRPNSPRVIVHNPDKDERLRKQAEMQKKNIGGE